MTEIADEFDVICVADGPRISLSLACHMLVSRKTCPNAKYHVAVPKDASFEHEAAERVIKSLATSIYEIPPPSIIIESKLYRLENKINAMKFYKPSPAILIDSDLLFLRPLPASYVIRDVPTAVPEHGLHEYPWQRLYETLSLEMPRVKTLLGSGETSPPWLNAGFVATPNAEKFGNIWRMASSFVLGCDWVPERWPYLDQISLPLAIAMFSKNKTVNYDSILPSQFNDNVFYWHPNQSYASNSFVIYHHYRVGLLKRYVPGILSWVRDGNPVFDDVLNGLSMFDDAPSPKPDTQG